MRSHLTVGVMAGALLLVQTAASAGQQPPPIDGVTGTVVPEDTRQKTHDALNTVAIKTADGIEHLFHLTERSDVHERTETGEQALRGIEEGSRAVVHETMTADQKTTRHIGRAAEDAVKATKGVITHVDWRAKSMVIRLADGTRETFRLTDRAVSGAATSVDRVETRIPAIVISFSDEAGRHVAYYFTRVS
ncbi:MAG: hypothetical protein JWL71_4864 [Acidobacteria bacterium]|nr:hypothetical protein [Acidobacteriota bacterium]